MGSGKPKEETTNTNQTTTRSLLPEAQQYLPMLYGGAANATRTAGDMPLPTQFIAGPSGAERAGVDMLLTRAPSLGSVAPSLTSMAGRIASGEFLDPSRDPTFAGAARAAIDPITRTLTERVLPGITHSGITNSGAGPGAGAYGGSATAIDQGTALRDWETQAGNITSSMANTSRNAGMSLIPQAAGIAKAGDEQSLTPALVTGQAGAAQTGWSQNALQDLIEKYKFTGTQPFAPLTNFANILTAGGLGTSNQVGTQVKETPGADPLTQALQIATGLGGTAASFFGSPAGGVSAWKGIKDLFA